MSLVGSDQHCFVVLVVWCIIHGQGDLEGFAKRLAFRALFGCLILNLRLRTVFVWFLCLGRLKRSVWMGLEFRVCKCS